MKTSVKVSLGILGLGLITLVGFQNCAEPFATKLDGKYASTGFGSSGTGASGTGTGGTGSGGATPTPTPPPDSYTLNVTSKLYTPVSAAAFDPASAATIVAVESVGNVAIRSDDAGVTWKKLCALTNPATSIFVNGTQAYGFYSNTVYRLVDVGGGTCPVLRTGTTTSALSIATNGRLYFWEAGKPLSTSVDNGKTWTVLTNAISSAAAPAMNPSALMFSRDFAGTDSVYAATVVGAERSVYKLTPTGATKLGPAYSSSSTSFQVDPKSPTNFYFYYYNYYVYASTDSGTTYKNVAAADLFSFVASDGVVYRTVTDTTTQQTTLSMKDSYAAVTWTPAGTFSGAITFDVNAKSIAVLDGKKLMLSKDAGVTYARVGTNLDSSALAIQSFAGSGNRLYAATSDFLLRSDDGGDSWVLKAEISGLGSSYPRLQVSPGDVNRVYLRSDRYNSTYQYTAVATSDGFDTLTSLNNQTGLSQIMYGFEVSLALGADPETAATISNSGSFHLFSDDIGWSMKTAPTNPSLFIWYPWLNSYLLPGASDKSLIGIGTTLYEYSFSSNAMTAVSSRVPFADMMGMEMKSTGAAANKIWIVSQQGSIAESSDGVTFTLKSSALFGTTVTSSNNQGFVAAADAAGSGFLATSAGSNNVATSSTAGSAWKVSTLSGCSFRDAVAAKKAWLVACSTGQPRFIAR